MRRHLRLITVFLLLFSTQGQAQTDISFRRIGIAEGLTQSSVQCMFQDSRGLLWIGTQAGLNRYDGIRITTYVHDPADPRSVSNNDIIDMCEGPEGTLWIATPSGVDILNPRTEQFQPFRPADDQVATSLAQGVDLLTMDSQGAVWMYTAYGEVLRHDSLTGTTRLFAGDPEKEGTIYPYLLTDLVEDSAGTVWFAALPTTLFRFDPVAGQIIQVPLAGAAVERLMGEATEPDWLDLWVSAEGKLCLGAGSYGLFVIDTDTGELNVWRATVNERIRQTGATVTEVIQQADGTTWIGTHGTGLLRVEAGSNTIRQYSSDKGPPDFGVDHVHTLLEDASGLVWAGTLSEGAIAARRQPFARFGAGLRDGYPLSDDDVSAVFVDETGALWVATLSGLDRIDRTRESVQTWESIAIGTRQVDLGDVQMITGAGENMLLIGGDFFGIMLLNTLTMEAERLGDIVAVVDAARFENGTFWLAAGWEGLFALDINQKTVTHYGGEDESAPPWAEEHVQQLEPVGEKRLWVGTDKALYLLDTETGSIDRWSDPPGTPQPRFREILSLATGENSSLWIGTTFGLLRFDPAGENSLHISRDDGLPHNLVYSTVVDQHGNVWAATNNGLAQLGPDGTVLNVYGPEDGLQSREFNQNAAFLASDGELFLGGVRGLNVFCPESLETVSPAPDVLLLSARFGDTLLKLPENGTSTRTFTHAQRDVSFSYSGMDLFAPENLRYRYRLEGYDPDWRESESARNSADFTNLPAGDYRFQVQTATGRGPWLQEGASYSFTVLPPWWATWWMWVVYIALFGGGIFGVMLLREQRLRRQRRELRQKVAERTRELQEYQDHLEELVDDRTARLNEYHARVLELTGHIQTAVEREKEEIARDVHDELGQTLTILKYNLARAREEAGDAGRAQLDSSLELLGGVISSVKRISTRLRPAILTDMGLSAAIQWYAKDFARKVGLRCTAGSIPKEIEVPADLATAIFRIAQEALTNVAKHAEAEHVDISLVRSDGSLFLTVSDDGRGIDSADMKKRKSFGIIGMKERVRFLGGTLSLTGTPGAGTMLRVEIPLGKEGAA